MTAGLVQARAEDGRSGALLLKLCLSTKEIDSYTCNGYLLGVIDTVAMYQQDKDVRKVVCLPEIVDNLEMRKRVVEYIKAHPRVLEYSPAGAALEALIVLYPCPKSKPPGRP